MTKLYRRLYFMVVFAVPFLFIVFLTGCARGPAPVWQPVAALPVSTTKAARVHIWSLEKVNRHYQAVTADYSPVWGFTALSPAGPARVYLPHWDEVGTERWCGIAKHELRHVLEGEFHP